MSGSYAATWSQLIQAQGEPSSQEENAVNVEEYAGHRNLICVPSIRPSVSRVQHVKRKKEHAQSPPSRTIGSVLCRGRVAGDGGGAGGGDQRRSSNSRGNPYQAPSQNCWVDLRAKLHRMLVCEYFMRKPKSAYQPALRFNIETIANETAKRR